jgi:hypothetical protein
VWCWWGCERLWWALAGPVGLAWPVGGFVFFYYCKNFFIFKKKEERIKKGFGKVQNGINLLKVKIILKCLQDIQHIIFCFLRKDGLL